MKKLRTRKAWIIVGIVFALLLILVLIGYNWVVNHEFRLGVNLIFNCEDTHTSYLVDDEGHVNRITIELPPSTTFEHKHSETAVTYYSKYTYEEFLQYYIDNGYQVEDGKVYADDGVFIMKNESEERGIDYKYSFIDIDLWQPLQVPEYPLDIKTVSEALEERTISCKVEEMGQIPGETEDYKVTGYTLKAKEDNKLLAEMTSFLRGEDRGYTLSLNSFDADVRLCETECKDAIVLSTILFGGFENDHQVYDEFIQNFDSEKESSWECEIGGIECSINFSKPNSQEEYTMVLTFGTK